MAAAPCGRGALPLVLVAISAALLTYNALLSSRSGLLPLASSSSFPTAAAAAASSRRFGAAGSAGRPRPFHTAVTASGSVYNTWQCRVMYHWFKEARRAPGGGEMGGFTRILHSGEPDEFVDEIPTFVADPLAEGDQVTAALLLSLDETAINFATLFHAFFAGSLVSWNSVEMRMDVE